MRPLSLNDQPRPLSLAGTETPSPLQPRPLSLGDEEPESDIGGAISRGIKTSLNPFGVDEKELQKPRTGAETAAEVAANVGTDILTTLGASTAAGALAGSVVPGAGTAVGTAVGLGLGLYRALGYEDLQSRARGEDFNVGRAALNVATEINPFLRVGGRVAKFATQGTLQSLQALSYGAGGSEAAIAGAVGGALGAVGHRRTTPTPEDNTTRVATIASSVGTPELGPTGFQRLTEALDDGDNSLQLAKRAFDKARANSDTEEALAAVFARDSIFDDLQDSTKLPSLFDDIPDTAIRISPEQIKAARRIARAAGIKDKKELAVVTPKFAKQLVLETEAADFARFVVRDPKAKIGPELFQAAKDKLGRSSITLRQEFESYRTQKYLKEAVTEAASEMAKEGTGIKDPLGLNVFRWFSDLKYASRAVDRVSGLNLEGITDAVSTKKNLHGVFMYSVTARTNKLLRQAKKAGMDRRQITKLLEAGEDKVAEGVRGEILKGFRGIFDDIAEYANKNGLHIDKIDNYVTRLTLDPAELVTTLRRRAFQYRNGQAIPKPEALHDKELHQVLKHLTGVAIRGEGEEVLDDLRRAVNRLDKLQGLKTKEGFEAIGTFKRKGDIPEFAREMDIGRILIRYANNISKSIHMEPIIRQLQTQVPILNQLGFKKSTQYLKNYIKNLSGRPSEFVGWVNAAQSRWKIGIDELIDKKELTGFSRRTAEATKSLPDFLAWSMSLIYPNYLGLSTKAILRNYTQPTMMTAPELGGAYGHKLVTKAWLKTLRDKKAGINLEETLQDLGYAPGQHIGEGMNEAASAMRGTVVGPAISSIDKVNEKLMYLYSKSDAINRYVTLHTSKQLTKDILSAVADGATTADQKAAMKFVRGLSPGVKSSVYKLAREGRLDQVEDLLSRYLISKTQFNYGPHAASEYARTMGRLFSMFTKWPAMVAGDVHELVVTRQFRKLAERHLAPWAILGGLNLWLMESSENPRKRAILGRSLLDIAPAASLSTLFQAPPSVDIAGGLGKSFMDFVAFDFEQAGKGAARALFPVVPFGAAADRIGSDLYAIIENKQAPWRR